MYKNTLSIEIIQIIGDYGIVKTQEQLFWNNGSRIGGPIIWYDVCLDKGEGDIVASYNSIGQACEWANENK